MRNFTHNRFIGKLIIIGVLLGIFFSLPLRAEVVDQVVAIVNNEIITLSELVKLAKAQAPGAAPSDYRALLERLIDQKLIDQDAKGLAFSVDEKEIDAVIDDFKKQNNLNDEQIKNALEQQGLTWEEYRKEIRQGLRRNQIISQKIRAQVTVSDKEIKKYYREHSDDFFAPAQIKIEQIFFPFPENATEKDKDSLAQKGEAALIRLKAGENFQKVAQSYNIPEGQCTYDIGTFKKGEMLNALDEEAFKLEPGSISNTIKTSRGIFIIHLIERSEEKVKKIGEVRNEIGNILLQEKVEKRFQEWLEELRKKAYIDIKI